ncbi:galactose-specific lectin nattectin [Kryptolebias marmoratus]|uniref:Galactose-specific lectin nattectin-like n=1 Tax=Kryptolebias marmoratus TaxID=37003 RepID=A0A3Q2ZS20_KRYMA|nr:galactose-specific lectin nattectin [Kryptolebias marmoratus]
MASGLYFTLLLCLTCALWTAADAGCLKKVRASRCPSGWTQHGTRCFLFRNIETDWATAERTCIAYGGNLASFHNINEFNFLRALVYGATRSYKKTWVGGNDAAKDGVWMWTDGSRFNFSYWYNKEPNNSGGRESCLEINFNDKTNDVRCSTKRPYICAREL